MKTEARYSFEHNHPTLISEKLLEVLGCRLMPMNPSHQWINEALHVKYPEPFKSAQSYLEAFDVEI